MTSSLQLVGADVRDFVSEDSGSPRQSTKTYARHRLCKALALAVGVPAGDVMLNAVQSLHLDSGSNNRGFQGATGQQQPKQKQKQKEE